MGIFWNGRPGPDELLRHHCSRCDCLAALVLVMLLLDPTRPLVPIFVLRWLVLKRSVTALLRAPWVDGFYEILAPRVKALLDHPDRSVRDFAAETVKEIEVFESAEDSYGYVFCVTTTPPALADRRSFGTTVLRQAAHVIRRTARPYQSDSTSPPLRVHNSGRIVSNA